MDLIKLKDLSPKQTNQGDNDGNESNTSNSHS